jgi:hypothetical protein
MYAGLNRPDVTGTATQIVEMPIGSPSRHVELLRYAEVESIANRESAYATSTAVSDFRSFGIDSVSSQSRWTERTLLVENCSEWVQFWVQSER